MSVYRAVSPGRFPPSSEVAPLSLFPGSSCSSRRVLSVRRSAVLLLAAVVSVGLAAVNPAAAPAATGAGTLDGSFGTGGRAMLDWNHPQPATLVGVSGPYVAAAVGDRYGLGRFNEYGQPTLGADGTVTVGFGKPATARGIVDDALVVGNAGDDFGLVHFGPDGQADLRFGSAGRLTIGFGGSAVAWGGVRTWDSYGWVLVGSARTGSTSQAALARIDLYGNLVGGFGAGGKVLADFGPGDDEARSVATDKAKNLIVAGRSGDAAVIARYTPSGALDPGFGTGGVVRLDLSPGEDVVQ
ncbi:MAG: hypothetical protein LC792_10530, partial [Actinobacteria bacterium]|nr:hypothetical protein [Actinomycetota bacterium]